MQKKNGDARQHRRNGKLMMNVRWGVKMRDIYALVCSILSLIALVFSWITMLTQKTLFYIMTILFGISSLALAAYVLFLL